ncbi:TetR/AcrR family transcriptional regulator [Kitasatospora camelliae]|uniref:TetR/AcrR family transcriptional regulator n=1 Tax=Kitasatospora camelliae TaxID=3156397 RepID=A0AAU8K7U4_9ACTN
MADKPRDPGVSIWVRPPRAPRRGSAPTGLSRDRILRAATDLLDAEGVEAFSMRKLAAALDVTPMSVYWYVDNKDELLELALDTALGEMRVDPLAEDAADGDWREHLRLLVHEYRNCFARHPWAAQLAGRYLAIGPNAVAFNTSAVGTLRRTGLEGERLMAALGLVLQFAYGYALVEAQWLGRVKASGRTEDELGLDIRGIAEQADSWYAENADLQPGDDGMAAARERQFEAGLDLALAGIAAAAAAAR